MTDTIDAQSTTIGVGTVVAVAVLGYGTLVSETIFGIPAATVATGVFALTFLAIAVLHVAVGRADLGVAHALAAIGLVLVAIAATGLQVAGGLLFLAIGGAYIAVVTVRARRAARGGDGKSVRQ